MPSTHRAYAFDVRTLDTEEVLGVGVFTPALDRLIFLTDGAATTVSPTLSMDLWHEFNRWVHEGDANLPLKPPPMSARQIAVLLPDADTSRLIARRFAVFPLAQDLGIPAVGERVLAGLLSVRRSAA